MNKMSQDKNIMRLSLWGDELRSRSLKAWENGGKVPHRKAEGWQFTPVWEWQEELLKLGEGLDNRGVEIRDYDGEKGSQGIIAQLEEQGLEGINIRIGGGGINYTKDRDIEGVYKMVSGSKESEGLLKANFGTVLGLDHSPFVALNSAFSGQVLVIYIADNVHCECPIFIDFVRASLGSGFSRILVILGSGSQCTLVENFDNSGSSEKSCSVPVMEIMVGDGAKCFHYKVQGLGDKDLHIATSGVQVGERSFYERVVLQSGGILARDEVEIYGAGEESDIRLSGIYIANNQQKIDQTIRINHMQPNISSRQLYKGILSDKAHGVFQGKIFVDQIAQKTDGYQINRTLLLSEDARMHAKPELEIYADDVKCSHGATLGELDKNMLYYLRSRGISKPRARDLLLMAHIEEVLGEMSNLEVSKGFRNLVERKLQSFSD